MPSRPYFAKKTDNANDEGRKKLVVYALCYIAIGVVVNLALFLSDTGISTPSCQPDVQWCPTAVELIGNVILRPDFWLNIVIWPVKLAVFLWHGF